MNKIEEFIAKLSKVEYNKSEDSNSIEGQLRSSKGGLQSDVIRVSFSTELASNMHDIKSLPIQIVVRVAINGIHAQTWGCMTNEDHAKFVEFFVKSKAKANDIEWTSEKVARESAHKLFKAL